MNDSIIDYNDSLDLQAIPKYRKIKFVCSECGKEYITYKLNFSVSICPRCKKKIKAKSIDWYARNAKSEQTKLMKYGDSHYVNPIKALQTKLERYGDAKYNNFDKAINTNIEKYGVKYSWLNDIVKDKIKDSLIKRYGEHRDLIFEKVKKTNNIKYGYDWGFSSDIIKAKIIDTCLRKYNVTNGGASTCAHSKMHKKYEYCNITFDSSWELALYIFLKDRNINFEYLPETYFEYYVDGQKHIYYPDFKIGEEYVEVKGDHFFENDNMINPFDRNYDHIYNEKFKCMQRNNVKIMKHSDIIYYINYIEDMYGKDYLNKFKK